MALKIGSEDKKKVILATVLGVVVIGLLVNFLWSTFGSDTPPAPATTPAPVARTTARTSNNPAPSSVPVNAPGEHPATKIPGFGVSLDPTLHPELMAQAESLEYAGKGRNIFSMSSAPAQIEQVKAPIHPSKQQVAQIQVPQGPPPPPPIDLKFFGYEARKDGSRKAFLLHGDDIFVASEGDIVDHRYKVLKIAPFNVQVEDIPYHNAQPLPLVQN